MVIDTSALVAITLREPSRQSLLEAIEAATTRVVSSVSLLEAGMVLRAWMGESAVPRLYRLIEESGCEVAAFDGLQARLAVAAFGRFGKGMGHRAQLNFGDCAVYAFAQSRGGKILATGDDFRATDLMVVRP